MSNSMLVTMLLVFATVMFGWHKIAIYIVAHYGIVGTVIACSVILAASFIADR
jgi:hypothetical protein